MDKSRRLNAVTAEILACAKCKTGGSGKPVPGEGSPDADVVFVGEAPGKTEAETGRPFVGRSGLFLRSVIEKAGLTEHRIYITSPVKYKPLEGTPTPEQIRHGTTHLLKQLDIIQPKIVVLMGSTACYALLGKYVPVMKEHGIIQHHNGITYLPTVHPASANRFPTAKKAFLEDFGKLKTLLKK